MPVSLSMRLLVLCFSLAGWCLVVGCGGDSGRKSVEGTVTLDGQPLPSGSVTFVPLPGTKSPTAGAKVVDGKFSIPAQKGTFDGKFRVEITATRASGRKVPDRWTGKLVDDYQQYLPARYNTASKLKADVQTGVSNRFEFSLESKLEGDTQ